jgi:hypothetical protein
MLQKVIAIKKCTLDGYSLTAKRKDYFFDLRNCKKELE